MEFDFYNKLVNSKEFQNWQKNSSQSYLTHFYCQLNNDFKQLIPWEIGFYNKETDKITVFNVAQTIEIKPEDTAFKKQGIVEELDLEKVKINFPKALELFQKAKKQHYPQEILLNGFLILQNIKNQTLWNISFATKSMNILNIKINVETKEVVSHQLINFIAGKAG